MADFLDDEAEEVETGAEDEPAAAADANAEGEGSSDDEPSGDEGADAGTTANEKRVPLAALKDERGKRQALAKENTELKRRLDAISQDVLALKQGGKKEPVEEEFDPKELFENPKKVFGEFASRLERKKVEERTLASWEDSKLTFDDFEEVVTQENVEKWVSATPGAQESLRKSLAPAKLAYRGIQKMLKQQASGDDSPKLKELSESLAKIQKENEELRKILGKPARSLAGSRSSKETARSSDDNDAGIFAKY